MNLRARALDVLAAGIFWMLLWAAIGALLSIVIGIVDPPSIDPGEGPIDMARILGGVGALCGLVFGTLLTLARRGKPAAGTPLLHAAFWGVVAGAAVPLLSPAVNDVVVLNTCPLGALAATLYVAWARARRPAAPAPATT